MATTATIPSITSPPAPTVLVECRHNGACYFSQTTLPYTEAEAIADLIQGQHDDPMRVLLIDPAAGRCTDISVRVAEAIYRRAYNEFLTLPREARDFCEHHAGLRPALAA